MPVKVIPNRYYYIKCPTERKFDDCCNEFWNVATYVSKGLLRGEILFAIDHMNEVLRHELLRMISWYVGTEKGFNCVLILRLPHQALGDNFFLPTRRQGQGA